MTFAVVCSNNIIEIFDASGAVLFSKMNVNGYVHCCFGERLVGVVERGRVVAHFMDWVSSRIFRQKNPFQHRQENILAVFYSNDHYLAYLYGDKGSFAAYDFKKENISFINEQEGRDRVLRVCKGPRRDGTNYGTMEEIIVESGKDRESTICMFSNEAILNQKVRHYQMSSDNIEWLMATSRPSSWSRRGRTATWCCWTPTTCGSGGSRRPSRTPTARCSTSASMRLQRRPTTRRGRGCTCWTGRARGCWPTWARTGTGCWSTGTRLSSTPRTPTPASGCSTSSSRRLSSRPT